MNRDILNNLLNSDNAKLIKEHLSYTNQDYDAILSEMIELILSGKLTTEWNNISETDIFFIFMSLLAAHKDILNYMIDYKTLEAYMTTAKERQSVIRIANSFGYKIKGVGTAASKFKVKEPDSTGITDVGDFLNSNQFNSDSDWVYINTDGLNSYDKDTGEVYLFQGLTKTIQEQTDNVSSINKTLIIAETSPAFYNNAIKSISMLKVVVGDDISSNEFKEVKSVLGTVIDPEDSSTYIFEVGTDTLGAYYIKFPQNFHDIYTTSKTITITLLESEAERTQPLTMDKTVTITDSQTGLSLELSPTGTEFYKGQFEPTVEEIKEGFKTFYRSGSSLITLDDFYYYLKNESNYSGRIDKIHIYDKYLSTTLGRFESSEEPVGINDNELRVVLRGNNIDDNIMESIKRELSDKTLSSIDIKISSAQPLEITDVTIGDNTDTITKEFKELISSLKIGESISIDDIREHFIKRDLISFRDEVSLKVDDTLYSSTNTNQNISVKLDELLIINE